MKKIMQGLFIMREKIFRVVAIALSACTFLGLVLDNFVIALVKKAPNPHPVPINFKHYFDNAIDYNRIHETMPWVPAERFMLYVCFVLAGIIIALIIIQAILKNDYLNFIIQCISIINILVGIASMILLLVGNNKTNAILAIKYTLSLGAYSIVLGIILGGISSLLSTYRVKIQFSVNKIEKLDI